MRNVFLFLQGPPGPFFARLGAALAARGHEVHRINLNGGDRQAWPGGASDFTGGWRQWPRYCDAFLREHHVTDLVLFGDTRPLHQAARRLATLRGVTVHVFEEGYIRPDFVTLERGGVNGHSTLPRDPGWYLAAARDLPATPDHPPIASGFGRRAGEALAYYTQTVLQRWRFRGYRSHRRLSPMLEGLGWVRRYLASGRTRRRSVAALRDLEGSRYFLFPLQLDSDAQVSIHSPFGTVAAALDYVVENFARTAPEGVSLVVKRHPLDNGLVDWARAAASAARRFGIADRMVFLAGGDIAHLARCALGVVTINSTTGTLSVGAGVPTIVLGDAVYDIPGVTHDGPLDGFWTAPVAPDPAIWEAFRRVLIDRCLVRGGFLSDEGLDLLVSGSVERLLAPPRADEQPAKVRRPAPDRRVDMPELVGGCR